MEGRQDDTALSPSHDALAHDVVDAVPSNESLFDRRYRGTTMGAVVLVALYAFEALAVATAMPTVAQALDGLPLYALAFGGTLASSVAGNQQSQAEPHDAVPQRRRRPAQVGPAAARDHADHR